MHSFSGFSNLSVDESEQLPELDSVPHLLDGALHMLEDGWVGDDVSICMKFLHGNFAVCPGSHIQSRSAD